MDSFPFFSSSLSLIPYETQPQETRWYFPCSPWKSPLAGMTWCLGAAHSWRLFHSHVWAGMTWRQTTRWSTATPFWTRLITCETTRGSNCMWPFSWVGFITVWWPQRGELLTDGSGLQAQVFLWTRWKCHEPFWPRLVTQTVSCTLSSVGGSSDKHTGFKEKGIRLSCVEGRVAQLPSVALVLQEQVGKEMLLLSTIYLSI